MQRLMKTTKILFIATAAVAMTLASCTKELNGNNEENNQTSGLRTLTVSFATSPTRTTLDGMQPKWSVDDEILLADGTNEMETHTVTAAEAGTTSFEIITSLTGTITAVYPKAAALTSGNSITGIKVSATQDGSFGSANICMATAAATEKELTFKNQTAVFEVSVPSGTKQLTVTSLNPVSDGQRATSGAVAIADASATTITVGNNTADIPNPCYVSVLAPATGAVLLQDLNFDTGSAQGGFSPKYITSKGKTPSSYAVEVNTMYTLAEPSLHAYVTVGEGADARKWATMNVGATSETDYGTYFAWGDVTGQNAPTNGTGAFSTGFPWDNCPFVSSYYCNEEANRGDGQETFTFTKYYDGTESDAYTVYLECNQDDKTTLDLEDDAAFCNWGGAWRMPTKDEFDTLADAKKSWDESKKGLTFGNPSIFLPAAGCGDGTVLYLAGSYGYYWSSSLLTDAPYAAYSLYVYNDNGRTDGSGRRTGNSVRPLSE